MPELPEVETIRRALAPRLEGRRIAAADVRDPRWCAPEAAASVAAALRGRRIEQVGRRGKYLTWALDGDHHLVLHLRMTGTLLYDAAPSTPHTRVHVTLDDDHALSFVDPRRFGTGHLLDSRAARDAYFARRLGFEPLDPEFTLDHVRRLARGCRAPVKAFLLDQKRIAGVGNIYADEALHRAGIHPLRPAGRLTSAQLARLRDGIREALRAGVDAHGASIDDFRDPDGERGAFQDEFRVHRRAGAPCPTCGTAVRKLVAAGRGTYVCERCQPRPRTRRSLRA